MASQIPPSHSSDYKLNFKVMIITLITGVVLMAAKFLAYLLTGSTAILSDALESIINVVAGAFALVSVVMSAKPPDEDHPYGHGKIEYFSAGFEGALIIIAAVGIFWEGMGQILNPQPLPKLDLGLLILLGSALVNLALGLALTRTAKKTGSMVLLADGRHILTDVYTSAVVLMGLIVVHFTDWYRADGAVACIAGVNIVVSGLKLVKQSFKRLMDSSDPELLREICDLVSSRRRDIWIDIHRLRAWRSGNRVHIDFHLILPRQMPLIEVHEEVKFLEAILGEHFKNAADVLIHLDPCEDPECPICSKDPCELRLEEKNRDTQWNSAGMLENRSDNKIGM